MPTLTGRYRVRLLLLPALLLPLLLPALLRAAEETPPEPPTKPDEKVAAKPGPVAPNLTGRIDRGLIDRLPLVGRRYTDLLTLAPGVMSDDAGSLNAAGARAPGLQHRLDDADITDPVAGGPGLIVNLETVLQTEVETRETPVAFGRFDGGLARINSPNGGDEHQGSLKIFWRGDALDGSGTGETSDVLQSAAPLETTFDDFDASATAGGPILANRLWYFASVERDGEVVDLSLQGNSTHRTALAYSGFGKISWRAAPEHTLSLTQTGGPRRFEGLFLGFGTPPESDGTYTQHGRFARGAWQWRPSGRLTLDTQISWLDSGVDVTPASGDFHRVNIPTIVNRINNRVSIQALYPVKECSIDGTAAGFIPNCDPALGPISLSRVDLVTGGVTGPLSFRTDDLRERRAVRADAGYLPSPTSADHALNFGFEADFERYEDDRIDNPILFDLTSPCPSCRDQNGQLVPNAVTGIQQLLVPVPSAPYVKVDGTSSSAWLSDSWRPLPGVAVQGGVRVDREAISAWGYTPSSPRAEKHEFDSIVEALCAEALRIYLAGGNSNADQTCTAMAGFRPGGVPVSNLIFRFDAATPPSIVKYDRNQDLIFDEAVDGSVWREALSDYPSRLSEPFEETNVNLSPRVGVSWDPWSGSGTQAGKTKLFATWGRFFDRLALGSIAYEGQPSTLSFVFEPDPFAHLFVPGQRSFNAPSPSITQIDRALRTPRTDVFTLGGVRDLTTRWSAGLSFTQRSATDLLQDFDVNHITCRQHDDVFGIDPFDICGSVDPNIGPVILTDQFGTSSRLPNRLADLYVVNSNFDQILRVGNLNSATYRAVTVETRRALAANWQLQASYTYSRATGDSETFTSFSRDDVTTRGAERAPLDWDRRHRLVLVAAGTVGGVELGTRLTWESGIPYSVTALATDFDNAGNANLRVFYPTGERNDQRNGGTWLLDARVAKRFQAGRLQIGAEASVTNLLDRTEIESGGFIGTGAPGASSVALDPSSGSLRRPGRAWQLGTAVFF